MPTNVTEEQVEKLPTEKLIEALENTTGWIGTCPNYEEHTAFIGKTGINDTSKCHNCKYETGT